MTATHAIHELMAARETLVRSTSDFPEESGRSPDPEGSLVADAGVDSKATLERRVETHLRAALSHFKTLLK